MKERLVRMGTYVMLMKFTEQGATDVLQAKQGRAEGKKAAKALGIEWKKSYLLLGEFDVMVIIEAPDEETVARYALLGGMSGAVTTRTFRAFTEAEADALVGSLAELAESA